MQWTRSEARPASTGWRRSRRARWRSPLPPFPVVKAGVDRDCDPTERHGDEHPAECVEIWHQRQNGGLRVSQNALRDLDTCRAQDARLLRAIGRAWDWRRKLERGDVNTIADLAREEGISDRYVSRVIRLAWLAPSVLERLVLRREPTVLSIFDLCGVAELPWIEQPRRVFD